MPPRRGRSAGAYRSRRGLYAVPMRRLKKCREEDVVWSLWSYEISFIFQNNESNYSVWVKARVVQDWQARPRLHSKCKTTLERRFKSLTKINDRLLPSVTAPKWNKGECTWTVLGVLFPFKDSIRSQCACWGTKIGIISVFQEPARAQWGLAAQLHLDNSVSCSLHTLQLRYLRTAALSLTQIFGFLLNNLDPQCSISDQTFESVFIHLP